jgi:hypothetical protein
MFQSTKHALGHTGWQVACLLASTGCLFEADAGSKPAQPVSIYLNVEKDGGLVTGLTEKTFRLSLDGKPQPFRSETPEPCASALSRPSIAGRQPTTWTI